MLFSLRLFTFLMCLLMVGQGSQAADGQTGDKKSYTVIFSTFENSSAGKYNYLSDSIQAMIISRLASNEKIEVLDSALAGDYLASLKKNNYKKDQVQSQLQADYLISGALYELNSGLNVQVMLYPLKSEGEILRFSIVTDTSKSLLVDIETLTNQIGRDAFGQGEGSEDKTGKNTTLAGNSGFITEHPEAAYKKKLYAGVFSNMQGSGVRASAQGAKRTVDVPIEMVAMTVGDLDLDGKEEILILSQSELQLFGLTEDGLELLDKMALSKYKRNHAINMADINGDGIKEIYISATEGLGVSSSILVWQPDPGFSMVEDNIPWYLRPVKTPENKWVLMGQKRGVEKIEFVQPGIYQLELNSNYEVTGQNKVALPRAVNLFDFVYANLDGIGSSETVVIDPQEKMRVYNSSNELLWVSNRKFGGSSLNLGPSQGDAVNETEQWGLTVDEEFVREPIFVPNPVIVDDFDQNGSQDVIVNENESTFLNFFYKIRVYRSSQVVGLTWKGERMQELWRTGKFKGAISAYSFASHTVEKPVKTVSEEDIKNTGRLFVGHIPAKGTLKEWLPGSLDSELKVYELEFTPEVPKK